MEPGLVYAITVNWNRKEDTLQCLESLACQTYPNLRILVIDNHSHDNSPKAIAERFPQAGQIVNPSNLGFAGGFNLGIQRALQDGADYVFIMNNDATIAPDCIAQLVAHVQPDTGILAPVIYYAGEPDKIWSMGGTTNRWNLERRDPWAGKRDPGRWPEALELDFVTGCGMLFPRQALLRTGTFDEDFQMYYEDSDLCLRTRRAGLKIRVIPAARMWHKVASSSGGSDSPNERYWMARSSIRYFRKHARGLQVPVILFWRTGSAIRTSLRLILLRKWQSLAAYWRGIRDGLRASPGDGS